MLVDFYLLGRTPLERVLPAIGERLLAEGQRLLVVTAPERIAALDAMLWSYRRDAFLPHGIAGAARAEQQPVLVSAEVEPVNGAANVALADGVWRDAALAFERTFYFFDQDGREAARAAWRGLAGNDAVTRRYWQQNEAGKWVQGP